MYVKIGKGMFDVCLMQFRNLGTQVQVIRYNKYQFMAEQSKEQCWIYKNVLLNTKDIQQTLLPTEI